MQHLEFKSTHPEDTALLSRRRMEEGPHCDGKPERLTCAAKLPLEASKASCIAGNEDPGPSPLKLGSRTDGVWTEITREARSGS